MQVISKIKASVLDEKRGEEVMEKTTFKIELQVEIEYNIPDGCPNTPYTTAGCMLKDNQAVVFVGQGKIVKADIKKLERK